MDSMKQDIHFRRITASEALWNFVYLVYSNQLHYEDKFQRLPQVQGGLTLS